MMDEQQNKSVSKKQTVYIPRRTPSIVIPPRPIIFTTADKTTCAECICFPAEDPYVKPKKLNPCQHTPLTLYELTAAAVDRLTWPSAFKWSEEDVALWMSEEVGLAQYKQCIKDNHINGMRLLMLEDPSKLPKIGINYFKEIQMITSKVRELFSTEFIRFIRSIGLPPRKPLTHCTWFKSRTGPSWGIRRNWSRSDILRWMKIIMPEPLHLDHWDLVWYHEPDFPKVMFARIPKAETHSVPHYVVTAEVTREYLMPRKFRFQTGIPEEAQYIWMEQPPKVTQKRKEKPKKKVKIWIPEDSRLLPKKISLTGLTGKDLLLARRKMPKPKFFK